MVSDTLTVFSVAGTVVQFVDFSLKIFARRKSSEKTTQKLNVQLQDLAQDLLGLGTKLRRPLDLQSASANANSAEEQRLQDICNSCLKKCHRTWAIVLNHWGLLESKRSGSQLFKHYWSHGLKKRWYTRPAQKLSRCSSSMVPSQIKPSKHHLQSSTRPGAGHCQMPSNSWNTQPDAFVAKNVSSVRPRSQSYTPVFIEIRCSYCSLRRRKHRESWICPNTAKRSCRIRGLSEEWEVRQRVFK